MPNLNNIRLLSDTKKVTLRRIAEVAGLTEQGLHGAISKGDIKFSYLDKIANFLGVDLSLFSDFSPNKETESKVSVLGHNLGNVASGNILQVSLPEEGTQKIINSDGTIFIESTSPNKNTPKEELVNNKIKGLLETINLQKQLIDSQKEQIIMLKDRNI